MSAISKKGPVSAPAAPAEAAGTADLNALVAGCTPSGMASAVTAVKEVAAFDAKIRLFCEQVLIALGRTEVEVSYESDPKKSTFVSVIMRAADNPGTEWCRDAWASCRKLLAATVSADVHMSFIVYDTAGDQLFP